MTHLELRQEFLDFWQKVPRNHIEVPSASLIPQNDPTTLFTGSGMQPMIPYLLGQPHPLGARVVDIQKCFRGQDIEEVGDANHDSFFEMMGNWSLGDYFKKEQITWYWEFLLKLGFKKENLYITCFEGYQNIPKDEESYQVWKSLGVSDSHLRFCSVTENWWSRSGTPDQMPVGEIGGPDSEVFYQFPNGELLEIGNSVFITYQKQADGNFKELAQKNVDFGGGLERTLAAINNDPDIFKTDLYQPIITTLGELSGGKYADNHKSFRIIADNIKAAAFLIADGVTPSNKMQGYFLRRLLRRAMVKMNKFSGDCQKISDVIIRIYKDTPYFSHISKSDIFKVIAEEQTKFAKTLELGLKKFKELSPFDLYQTYGFPIEVTQELYKEQGLKLDLKSFDLAIKKHQELSRTASAGMFKGGLADTSEIVTKYHTATHLLHAALREILGDHVHQEGSNLTSERLRFDFSFTRKVTEEELQKITKMVNEKITAGLERKVEIMTYEEAIKSGALAFFKEKYPEKVTVYSYGSFSREVCGGPHVDNTKILGKFKIIKEESAGAGVRRIYAVLK